MRPPRFLAREKRETHERVWPVVLLLLFASFAFFAGSLRAEEPFFKKGDVIAIVGGEDMVALSEYGYLELLLTRALPDYHLRFRNLAWEGDTVFEQRRDLNFPPWEEQLEKIGATVVLCQFGQMESLAGKEKLPEFIAAYEKLLGRCSGGGKRRLILAAPFIRVNNKPKYADRKATQAEIDADLAELRGPDRPDYEDFGFHYAKSHGCRSVWAWLPDFSELPRMANSKPWKPDGIHLTDYGQGLAAMFFADQITSEQGAMPTERFGLLIEDKKGEPLRQLIIAKNRLWFDYWRVQNWAFLAGDRTNQPSSRDHLDPTKRWFPEERERFLPLIEAKERAIDALAEKLHAP